MRIGRLVRTSTSAMPCVNSRVPTRRCAGGCLGPCHDPLFATVKVKLNKAVPRPDVGKRVVAHAGHGAGQHGHSHHEPHSLSSCGHGHSHGHAEGPSLAAIQPTGGSHGHCDHSHDHSHGCGGEHSHSHGHSHSCGHSHDHHNPSNPAHRLLKSVYDATRLTPLAEWLEGSKVSTVGKIVGILLAALAAWLAGSGLAATQAAAAAQLKLISSLATWGVYLLAGVPAMVDLSYDLTAGKIDTHVLMTLSALGTLLSGYAIEGALLLVLFQTSHTLEHLLSHKAQGNLQALYDTIPKSAVLVEVNGEGAPQLSTSRQVRASEVAVGAYMLVKPGEQIPLDGAIIHGKALVSAELITGESLPVLKRPGDELPAGALNRDGLLVVRASRPAEESTPARIARLTLDAQATRPKLRTWLDEFGEAYSKLVVAASLGALLVMLGMGVPLLGSAAQRGAFYRAMGLLTVASPCALVMVPLAYVSAIAAVASRGILLKGGRVLDALSGCRTVAFDKTGTLTTGSLVCTSMQPLHVGGEAFTSSSESDSDGGDSWQQVAAPPSSSNGAGSASGNAGASARGSRGQREALQAAVALSQRSSHPVSEAVVLMGEREHGLDPGSLTVSDFRLVAGGGVEGTVRCSSGSAGGEGPPPSACWFGSLDFVLPRLTVTEKATLQRMASTPGQAATSVLSVLVMEPAAPQGSGSDSEGGLSSSGTGGGSGAPRRGVWLFRFEDSVRRQSASAVASLQQGSWANNSPSLREAVQVLMLTGDNPASAEGVARKLGIGKVFAALSPEQKLGRVTKLKSGGNGGVIMVGDGINDAPALATADVGIAIASTATAAASAAADVIVLNSSGIAAVPFLLLVARDTQAVIRQNLALAATSILALVVPTVLGAVPLWLAVFVHEGSTLLVALNSLRPLRHAARFAGASGKPAGGSAAGPAVKGWHLGEHAAHAEDVARQAAAAVKASPAM